MFCENCGKELPENALFCNSCGVRVTAWQDSGMDLEETDISMQDQTPESDWTLDKNGDGQTEKKPLTNKQAAVQQALDREKAAKQEALRKQAKRRAIERAQQVMEHQQIREEQEQAFQMQQMELERQQLEMERQRMNAELARSYTPQIQSYPTAAGQQPTVPPEYTPISMWGYFGYQLLFCIPLVGFILLCVFSFGGTKNINLRNFARSYFCTWIIIAVLLVLVFTFTGTSLALLSY